MLVLQKASTSFRVATQYQPLLRRLQLDAGAVFFDPRIVVWRKLPDRENCTLDADVDGRRVRLHVKRYEPSRGMTQPAQIVARGHKALEVEQIPTAPLVGWGSLPDGRSFTIWDDLTGYTPADKLIERGTPFDLLLAPTADLAAKLHASGLHHRDLYLCHFMVKLRDGAVDDVRLIDTARVARLGSAFTRKRWIVKDLAQFWYSTSKLSVTDAQREAWLERYVAQYNLPRASPIPGMPASKIKGLTAQALRRPILSKVELIARHDRNLNAQQPRRNISIPPAASGAVDDAPKPMREPPAGLNVRPATVDDAQAIIDHVRRIADEPDCTILMEPGEFTKTLAKEQALLASVAESDNSLFLIAEIDGKLVGVLHCNGWARRRARHVTTLGLTVDSAWRGRGVGSALLTDAIQWARTSGVVTRIELQVFASNRSAVRLYERFGFVVEGTLRRAVRRNGQYEDNLVMGLLL